MHLETSREECKVLQTQAQKLIEQRATLKHQLVVLDEEMLKLHSLQKNMLVHAKT
jgi:hypothetical protein